MHNLFSCHGVPFFTPRSKVKMCYNKLRISIKEKRGSSSVRRFIVILVAAVIGTVLAVPLTTFAETRGGGSVQGYASDTPLDYGTIVRLAGDKSDRVTKVGKDQLQNMFGVTVDPQQLPIKLTSGTLENEAFVAVSGTYNVLVSTEGGSIAAGDYVTLSSVNGLAMKAGTEEPTVFGRAVRAFDGKSMTLGSTQLKDSSGATKSVQLGSIPVTIDIKRNPNEKSTKAKVPEMLERIGQAIAEKEVSAIRIYISLGITAVSLITAIIVIYTGVRNSVISIGRNPMSKKSIFRALFEIILTSFLILTIGLFAVYLLLRL